MTGIGDPHRMDDPVAVDCKPTGRWVNERGTVIDLMRHPDGRVTGTVRFAADGTSYRPYEMRGTCVVRPGGRSGVVGTLLEWPSPKSVTVWCGEIDEEGIMTTFLLAASGPSFEWAAAAGGVSFRRST